MKNILVILVLFILGCKDSLVDPEIKSEPVSTYIPNNFLSYSSSKDGKYMTFISGAYYGGGQGGPGYFYVSQDYGNSWMKKEPCQTWQSVKVSESGQYQTIVGYENIYVSSNYGETWRKKISFMRYGSGYDIDMSQDGAIQVAVSGANEGLMYVSSDFGETWVTDSSNTANLRMIAISGDAKKRIVLISPPVLGPGADNPSMLVISTQSGYGWHTIMKSSYFHNLDKIVAISRDGKVLVTVLKNSIFISTNDGESFVEKNISSFYQPTSIAVSEDGQYQTIVYGYESGYGHIFRSSDYGNTWRQVDSTYGKLRSVSIPGDGKIQLISAGSEEVRGEVVQSGGIYVSYDYGETWSKKY